MKPTEVLSGEHRIIEQVLDCLEKIATATEHGGKLDTVSARKSIVFLRTLADTCHHGKEEKVLFPALQKRGMPVNVGPVAVMLGEHEEGRALIGAMDEALGQVEGGETAATARFAESARCYVALLRDHIAKEDNVLFPMAEAVLRDEDRVEVLKGFERGESEEMGAGTHESMLGIANELAEKYGVALASERAPAAAGGCCHHAAPHAQPERELVGAAPRPKSGDRSC